MLNTLNTIPVYFGIAAIDEANVHHALNNLRYSSTKRHSNPLLYLLLVDRLLAASDLAASLYSRELALAQILTTTIRDALIQHRTILGLSPPVETCLLTEAKAAIVADSGTKNPELMAWSWLYYYYVRVDLDIRYCMFSATAHIDKRTVRRYRKHGVHRLTQKLVALEWQAYCEPDF